MCVTLKVFVRNNYKSVLLNDFSFVSEVIEICNEKVAIGNKSIFVIWIYRLPDKAKLPSFDAVLSNKLTRFGAHDCVFCDFFLWGIIIMRFTDTMIYWNIPFFFLIICLRVKTMYGVIRC